MSPERIVKTGGKIAGGITISMILYAVWWAACVNERVDAHEKSLTKQDVILEKLNNVEKDVVEIKTELKRLNP